MNELNNLVLMLFDKEFPVNHQQYEPHQFRIAASINESSSIKSELKHLNPLPQKLK
jgi:hypothetical protein